MMFDIYSMFLMAPNHLQGIKLTPGSQFPASKQQS